MNDKIAIALEHLPELDDEELIRVASLMKSMTDRQAHQFATVYRKRRREASTTLLLALIGFLGFAGVHRFYLNQVGMGVLYLLTGGLCVIGTIVDMFNHQKLALEYNLKRAEDAAVIVRAALPDHEEPRQLPEADT